MMNLSLEEAQALLLEKIKYIPKYEEKLLQEANGCILGEDIYAPINNPPFDRSPLDGYAFAAKSSEGASKETPVQLKVIGEVCAGDYFEGMVGVGEAVRIMTGAPIPKGCDCVLRQEDTDYGEEAVAIYKALKAFDNYCFTGEDIKEGTMLLQKGEKLNAITLGILSSMGIQKVKVAMKPKMLLICTGDELVEAGSSLLPGKIYNSNGMMMSILGKTLGMEILWQKHVGDTAEAVAEAIKAYINEADLIVTTGGVSVGKKDIMHDVIKLLDGERLFWRLAIQPGTPVLGSIIYDKLMISLSGNPFAALVNFELLVRPVCSVLLGDKEILNKHVTGQMVSEFKKMSKKRRFIRAMYEDGKVYLNHQNHASGALYTMSLCNCLIDIPAGTESLKIDDKVKVILLRDCM
ncbi:molybdopterin molybdotransferase MoeA [Cellulosilyticum ruminicola]|uniref:molybdopterin molybdotransferase MoeA n=1 Tax=Cellulosilyticum ruminicola TaxID=425254 RepID=UPI0006D1E073|nr:gephyrin-like molybdotransferase Glp [Cellulosilyticum ruminicola]